MKIAIFGGSFNPVHREHVNIVKAAASGLSLDKVIITPSHLTPAKTGRLSVSGEDRLHMCGLSFNGLNYTEISDFELKRGGVSYSYITCREFKKRYPNDDLYFIIGADMLKNFYSWKFPEEILKCVKLAVCAREDASELEKYIRAFKERFHTDAVKFGYTGADVSSTKIRVLAALGEETEEYLLPDTANYIKRRSLYKIRETEGVKELLTPERWAHTVRVALTAAENCSRFGISEYKAVVASALHDCAKYLKPDNPRLDGFVCPDGVPEQVVHQFAGAYVAEHTFGITDAEILDAIRYHTSGKENMSPLGKLLYLSDLLEYGRDFEGIKKLRELFSLSPDEALTVSLERQLNYLKSTGKPIYRLTERAYQYLKENKNEQ